MMENDENLLEIRGSMQIKQVLKSGALPLSPFKPFFLKGGKDLLKMSFPFGLDGKDHPRLDHRQVGRKPVMHDVQDIPPAVGDDPCKRLESAGDVVDRYLEHPYPAAGHEALCELSCR